MSNRKKRRNVEQPVSKSGKWKFICLIMIALTVFIYYQVYGLVKYTFGKDVTEGQIALYKWMIGNISEEKKENIDTRIDIAVLGNIKAKGILLDSYSEKGIVNYSSIFKNLSFKEYDYTIANLNTSIVLDNKSEGDFFANSKLLKELKDINIDMLVTATKELGNQKKENVRETVEEIKKYDMEYVGTNDNEKNSYYILSKNNIKVGILAYIDEDYLKNDSLNAYSKKKLKQDIDKIKEEQVDVIIAFVDALRSEENEVLNEKNKLLQEILHEGVDIVISSDILEQKLYKNTDNTKFIKYSLGDLIGIQDASGSDISKVLKINISKKVLNGKTTVNVKVENDKTLVALSNADMTKYKIVELDKEIEEFDESSDRITMSEYNYLKNVKANMDKENIK